MPTSAEEVRQCVLAAASNEEPLQVAGAGSKSFYGRPVEAPRTLFLAGLKGIVDYQPQELIVVVLPGTPLEELESTLAEHGQQLAFEPPHWSHKATVGGTVACNLSGPRRVRAGAARDHLLGFKAVSGRGEFVSGGGRVMKNVTGYDLSKLMCGSFGTLAVLTELVLKVLPAPETERTVVVRGLNDADGIALLTKAARSSCPVGGLAHLPADAKAPAPAVHLTGRGEAVTLLRVEGTAPLVEHATQQITAMADHYAGVLDEDESRIVWRAVREIEPLTLRAGDRLWRFSLPPAESAAFPPTLPGARTPRRLYDWGGGLLWCVLPEDTPAEEIHRRAQEAGGHARIVRSSSPPAVETPVFPPLAPANQKLHVQLKDAFDPNRVLNPGRMYAGI